MSIPDLRVCICIGLSVKRLKLIYDLNIFFFVMFALTRT